MNQDSFYRLTQHVLIEDTWLVDAARLLIVFFAWLTAALLAKLYWTHQTGKMNGTAAVGGPGHGPGMDSRRTPSARGARGTRRP